jgi:hypothetical protein
MKQREAATHVMNAATRRPFNYGYEAATGWSLIRGGQEDKKKKSSKYQAPFVSSKLLFSKCFPPKSLLS